MLIDLPENVSEEILDGVAVFSSLDNWDTEHDEVVEDYHAWIKKNHAIPADKVVVDRKKWEAMCAIGFDHTPCSIGNDGFCYEHNWFQIGKCPTGILQKLCGIDEENQGGNG